ncbi:hypothetical protein BJ944DRAFT_157988 [Cunninghamella echinulata]|nr:hypothetical protein BJ944DRAFT_157988 [Cunninghamella echinulata]
MYNIPEHSQSEDNVSANKPKKINNNQSWITNVTKKQHVVPSLDKRKTRSALSSRRSSVDSTLTTASQFEHITLEDRVRITFEIANILQKQTFLRKLADGLMLYGCPAHRLEYIMDTVSKTIAIQADYVTLPNCMLMSFIDPSMHTTETHFLRQPQGFDMDRLGEVYRLEKLVSHGEVTVDEAVEFLDNVSSAPVTYSVWLNPFIYALASFCACVMFYGGNFKEGGISACLAIFFSIYEIFSSRLVSFQPIYEITCCIIIGFIAVGIGNFGYCFTPVAFASFVIILPGYSMTVGLVEIVSRQLVSGVVRMVYAILYAFLLGYGITFGASIYNAIDPTILEGQKDTCQRAFTSGTCVTTESSWYYFLTVPLFAISYCGYLKASPSRWPFMIVISAIGFVVNWALSCQVAYPGAPNQVIQVVPAFAVGLVGNLYTKTTGKMSFDGVLLAVFYLVPGGLGLKAALGLFGGTDDINQYSSQGSAFALSMIETAIGISVGLFIATLIVYPKGSQHTPLMNF